jgi:hypothetical protein
MTNIDIKASTIKLKLHSIFTISRKKRKRLITDTAKNLKINVGT